MSRAVLIGYMLVSLLLSCTEYTPKPKGYFRLEPTQATYIKLPVEKSPYSFSVSDKVVIELPDEQQSGWINLSYPDFNVKIYCSYMSVTKETLPVATDESYQLADRITPQKKMLAYENPDQKVYGMLFELNGDVASPFQFYLTDSLSRFFRGALYYDTTPNVDSLAPMTEYLRKDIIELIQTFSWNN